jgi:hypothetical protein
VTEEEKQFKLAVETKDLRKIKMLARKNPNLWLFALRKKLDVAWLANTDDGVDGTGRPEDLGIERKE